LCYRSIVAIEPRPVKRGEISGDTDTPVKVTLKAMKELNGVDAIPDGSGLNFRHQGLNGLLELHI